MQPRPRWRVLTKWDENARGIDRTRIAKLVNGIDYAVYEHELIRVWPLDEPEREAKIAKFAKEYGFRLRFYRMGMCAIFDKWDSK